METREENLRFLEEAKTALENLQNLKQQSEEKSVQLKRLQKNLESETKNVNESINDTIKKRRSEIEKPLDSKISELNGRIKKEQSQKDKAKSVGMKARIENETAQLETESRELNNRIKMISSRNGVPGYANSTLFTVMSSPKGLKQILCFVLTMAVLFAALPVCSWLLWGKGSTTWLIIAFIICLAVFGGLYYLLVIRLKVSHGEELNEIKQLRASRAEKKAAIRHITNGIRRDDDESVYNLGGFDAKISELSEQVTTLEQQKKEALEHFDSVTQAEISDEIMEKNRPKLERLKEEIGEVSGSLELVNDSIRNGQADNAARFETVLGSEFMKERTIDRLGEYIKNGQAASVSEAQELFRNNVKPVAPDKE